MSNTGVKFRALDTNVPSEVGFVYKSWLGSYKNHADVCPYSIYRQTYQVYLDRIIQRDESAVILAVHPDHPDQIFGFACFEKSFPTLHYIYVKEDYRRTGVGSDLLEYLHNAGSNLAIISPSENGEFAYTFNTSLGRKFLRKRGGAYKPKLVRNELP